VLGSLHLPAFADAGGELDRSELGRAVADAIRFLDDVVETNHYPDEAIRQATQRTRKVGLGVMGFADLLLLRGLPYGGAGCEKLGRELIQLIGEQARAASHELAAERGPFPAWSGVGEPRRNATLLAIAPTGTLRLIAGCNGGIEPFLGPVLDLHLGAGGSTLRWVDLWVEDWARKHAADPPALLDALLREAPLDELPGLERSQRDLLRRAWEVDPRQQIELQASFQSHVDGAVSKTVHVPPGTGPAEIEALIDLAQRCGCKGLALFRRSVPAAGVPNFELSLPSESGSPGAEVSARTPRAGGPAR
jgi:ribonucleoside-diphosphate reductase alpha chain